jgi:hypothetical protein
MLRTAETIDKKPAQALFSGSQIATAIHGTENIVAWNLAIKRSNQLVKGLFTNGRVHFMLFHAFDASIRVAMPGLNNSAVETVVENGIKRAIRLLLDAGCYAAANVLAYSGMDTMAFLNMPANRIDVMRSDFIAWTEQYMQIAVPDPPTGQDLYGMRCTVLHGGAPSRFTREGRGRPIGHVTVTELVRAYFAGVDRFLAELAVDPERADTANRRMAELLRTIPT